jgi:hypothetical protein
MEIGTEPQAWSNGNTYPGVNLQFLTNNYSTNQKKTIK